MMKKHLPVWRYIYHIGVSMLFLNVFVYFFLSCTEIAIDPGEPNLGGATAKGKDGNLNFVLNFDDYGEGEEISMRSADDLEAETVVVPLGDGLSMFATLEPVTKANRKPSVALRAFTNNARINIVAYKEVASVFTYEHHVGYSVVVGGGLNSSLLRDELHTPFSLTSGTYKFVAYSYNDNTLGYPIPPNLPDTIDDIRPGLDLLWGESAAIPISSGSNDVLISMKHLFSKVKVEAVSSVGNISDISNVTMRGYTAAMTVKNGDLTARIDSAILFTGFPTPPFNAPSVSSSERIVYTAGSNPTVVDIGSVTIVGKSPYTNLATTFAKQLQSGYEYKLKLSIGNLNDVQDDTPPADFIPYVGAFWKANQTGERLIRIPRPSSGGADGSWSAVVIEGVDWIVLDTLKSDDSGVWTSGGPNHSGNDTNFDTQYPVGSIQTAVGGVMNAGTPQIYFRIGLRSSYVPTPTDSARYGVVLLTYNNNAKRQRIWIRQGEGSAYLMGPQDLGGDGSSWGSPDPRPEAALFSPYNTTYPIFGPVPYNNGTFTAYPSQAGAFFQWANNVSNVRYAHPPIGSVLWDSGWNILEYWETLRFIHESCPSGYRRPDDGTIAGDNSAGPIVGSEIRQSLWLYPQTGTNTNVQNSVFGYYADGFFDRRQIDSNQAVSGTNNDIAYIGNLFYNPNSKASLFFPASGMRLGSSGELRDQGVRGTYWTSATFNTSGNARHISFHLVTGSLAVSPNFSGKNNGANIRCVVNMSPSFTLSLATVDSDAAYTNYKAAPNKWKKNGMNGADLYMVDKIVVTSIGAPTTIAKWASGTQNAAWFATNGTSFTLTDGIPITEDGVYSIYLANASGNTIQTITTATVRGADLRDGSSAMPFLLIDYSTAATLNATVTGINAFSLDYLQTGNLSKDYELYENIVMPAPDSSGDNWIMAGNFLGNIDGNSHSIDGLRDVLLTSIDGASASVKNLALTNVKITNGSPLAGSATNNALIENCFVTGEIDGFAYIGGMVGPLINGATIQNCYTNIDITTSTTGGTWSSVGGIASYSGWATSGGNIINCYAVGTNTLGHHYNGGIIGWSEHNDVVRNCYALSPEIIAYHGGSSILITQRVLGTGVTGVNNYAYDGMTIAGNLVTTNIGTTTSQGANISYTAATDKTTNHYQITGGWGFDASGPWTFTYTPGTAGIASAGTNLPILKSFVGKVEQSPTMTMSAPTLSVSPDELIFGYSSSTLPVTVTSNQSWTVSNSLGWVTNVSPSSGTGNGTFNVTVSSNNTGVLRNGNITVTAAGLTETIYVEQDGGGGSADRITLDGSGSNAKLVITRDEQDPGLYFKFGSVVGTDATPGTFNTSMIVFNPMSNPGSISSWGDIAHMDSVAFPHPMNVTANHNLANVRAGMGDPCRLVGMTLAEIAGFVDNNAMLARETALKNSGAGGWRLPKRTEDQTFLANASTAVYGPYKGVTGMLFTVNGHDIFFPGAVYRDRITGIRGSGGSGYYWDSDSFSTTYGYVLYFGSISWYVGGMQRPYGQSIRCVRD